MWLRGLGACLVMMSCGGQIATPSGDAGGDAAVCLAQPLQSGCSCSTYDQQLQIAGGFCVCKMPSTCTSQVWECFDFTVGCPTTEPAEYSPCSDASLKCTYVQSDTFATELLCTGNTWQPVMTQTYCF